MDADLLRQCLAVARQAAANAADVIQRFVAGGFVVQDKADGTPVTEADVAAEKAIIQVITDRFPDHAVYGEETGRHGDVSTGRQPLWLIDPIDGTKSFVRGYPFFSTQIGLMVGGELLAGVSSAAHYDQVAAASRDTDAELNGQVLAVSAVTTIEKASISIGNIASLAGSPGWQALGRVLERAARTRGYGDFLHYHMLAAGQIDAVVESDVNILDIAALTVICRRAGAVFTDLHGGPITLETTSVLAANPALHQTLLRELNA